MTVRSEWVGVVRNHSNVRNEGVMERGVGKGGPAQPGETGGS